MARDDPGRAARWHEPADPELMLTDAIRMATEVRREADAMRREAEAIRREAEQEAAALRRDAAEWASDTRREAERHRDRVLAAVEEELARRRRRADERSGLPSWLAELPDPSGIRRTATEDAEDADPLAWVFELPDPAGIRERRPKPSAGTGADHAADRPANNHTISPREWEELTRPRRRWPIWLLVLLASVLALALAAGAYAVYELAQPPTQEVPDLVGDP